MSWPGHRWSRVVVVSPCLPSSVDLVAVDPVVVVVVEGEPATLTKISSQQNNNNKKRRATAAAAVGRLLAVANLNPIQ